MHILCPPPSRSTAQIKVFVRQWHEQIEKKFKQVVIIYPTLLHTSNYREHKQRQREGGSREEARKQSSNVSGGG